MDWSGVSGAVILGLAGLALISLLFWSGHAILNFLGDDISLGHGSSAGDGLAGPVLAGRDRKPSLESRERLATREEREEVNEIAGRPDRLAVDGAGERSL